VPPERLEAEICELAGHLAAATCRFLVKLGDFDARRGWASWEMNSCTEEDGSLAGTFRDGRDPPSVPSGAGCARVKSVPVG
jgi:hypothetical protein